MSLVCPISDHNIDENIARLNASITLLLVLAFMILPVKWIIFLILADFILRRILNGQFSYVAQISRFASGIFGFRKVSINAGPKLFAANVGFILSMLIAIFYYAGLPYVSFGLAGVLAFFALLESVFNICAACLLYPFVSKFLA